MFIDLELDRIINILYLPYPAKCLKAANNTTNIK